jgi:L-ascorbate metabolism protein UlaG (beta-lactamase superfamily)
MEKARWPFDGIDLIIITHDHFDHYAAGVINAYLNSNPDSIALSTERVIENLRVVAENDEIFLDRVIGKKVRSGESFRMILGGIGVELLNFPHGPGAPKNLGVILSIGGFRVLHTGDLDPDQTLDVLTQYKISEKEIDVALVPAFWMSISRYQPFLEEIDVSYIIPMHFDPATSSMIDTMQADFPEAIFFRNIYESWELLR